MHPVIPFVVAAILFGVGAYGVLVRRNAVLVLMAVEVLLNAVNLIFITADSTIRAALPATGQVSALFVIVLAAAEIGVGLALVLQLYRLRGAVNIDDVPLGPAGADDPLGPAKADYPLGPAEADVPAEAGVMADDVMPVDGAR
jgi:NADH-quinone oxidoreductase subunit K